MDGFLTIHLFLPIFIHLSTCSNGSVIFFVTYVAFVLVYLRKRQFPSFDSLPQLLDSQGQSQEQRTQFPVPTWMAGFQLLGSCLLLSTLGRNWAFAVLKHPLGLPSISPVCTDSHDLAGALDGCSHSARAIQYPVLLQL